MTTDNGEEGQMKARPSLLHITTPYAPHGPIAYTGDTLITFTETPEARAVPAMAIRPGRSA